MPMANSVRPSRQGRPKLSVMITGIAKPVLDLIARLRLAAERSGSSGSSSAWLPPSTLDTSTPLLAQINPWCVSVMSTPFLRRMTARLSRKASSITLASSPYGFAHATDSSDGVIVARSIRRPSALETILCFTTRMSPDWKGNRRRAASSLLATESPGWISLLSGMGIRRTSPPAGWDFRSGRMRGMCTCRHSIGRIERGRHRPLYRAGSWLARRVGRRDSGPLPGEALGASFAGGRKQFFEIRGIVDVDRNPGQVQHHARFAAGLGGSVMRFEAVVAKAKREKICGTAERGVSAAPISGRYEHAAFRQSLLQDFFEFPRFEQRNVGRNHQRALDAPLDADASGHFDGPGFPRIVRVRHYFKPIFGGQIGRKWIARYDRNLWPVVPAVERGKHIIQHGLRQRSARRLIEDARKPLLGR